MGAFIGFPSGHYSQVRDFVLGDSSLGLVLGDLYPLLCESLDWFGSVRKALRRKNMGPGVRLSDLETSLSSNAGMDGVEMDTATSIPSSFLPSVPTPPRSFHALKEECFLKEDTFIRFRDRFQIPKETRVYLPRRGEKSCVFAHGEVCFYEAMFLCGLKLPVHPFIMEFLHDLNIAPGQLMPNSWRIVISCLVIWTIIADGDMIMLNEFVHLYELVSWDRTSQLIVNLPLSFRYWKSRYFFVSGDG